MTDASVRAEIVWKCSGTAAQITWAVFIKVDIKKPNYMYICLPVILPFDPDLSPCNWIFMRPVLLSINNLFQV